jgi:hypothetical protein
MKKIVLILMCVCCLLFSSACLPFEITPNACVESGDRFVITKERATGNTIYIEMHDKTTKVMYVYIKLSNSGSLSVLYDNNGMPLLWQGE